jgi:hypothetical protein
VVYLCIHISILTFPLELVGVFERKLLI